MDAFISAAAYVGMATFVRVLSTVTVLSADEIEAATVTGDSRPKSGDKRNGRMVAFRTCSI